MEGWRLVAGGISAAGFLSEGRVPFGTYSALGFGQVLGAVLLWAHQPRMQLAAISAWWSGFVHVEILYSEGAYAGYRQPSQAVSKLRVRVVTRPYLAIPPR